MTDPETTMRHEDDTEATVVAPIQPEVVVQVPATVEAPGKSATQRVRETVSNAYQLVRLILLVLLGFLIALFVFRNWEDVSFDYVFGSVDLPLAIVMLIFAAVGIVVGMLIYWFLARRTRH